MSKAHIKLASDLRYAWHKEKALILADWCEERGLTRLAKQLRDGPLAWSDLRTNIATLCEFIDCKPAAIETEHKTFEDWCKGYGNRHPKRTRTGVERDAVRRKLEGRGVVAMTPQELDERLARRAQEIRTQLGVTSPVDDTGSSYVASMRYDITLRDEEP